MISYTESVGWKTSTNYLNAALLYDMHPAISTSTEKTNDNEGWLALVPHIWEAH
jgi:hypothetical protein